MLNYLDCTTGKPRELIKLPPASPVFWAVAPRFDQDITTWSGTSHRFWNILKLLRNSHFMDLCVLGLIAFKGPCGMLWPPKRQPVLGSQDKVMEAAKNACRYISMGKIRREDMAGGCSTATCPLSPCTYLPRRLWRVSPRFKVANLDELF